VIDTVRTWFLLRHLRAAVKENPGKVRDLQDGLLRDAVGYAYDRVPFYRRFWDERGFEPRGFRGLQDLGRIPILTSQMVREDSDREGLLASNVDTTRCSYLDTAGSSGSPPLRVWRQALEERVWRATGLCIWFEHGFHWRHVTARFQTRAGPAHALQRLGISRVTWIPTDRAIDEQLAQFREAKADVVVGTPTSLRSIAGVLETSNEEFKPPRILLSQGELLDRETRQTAQRVFGIDPVDVYGQTEVGYIAWQCEQRDGFHVNAATHLVEVLRQGEPASPGELGAIVVTDLRNRTMPFLRYDTGDLAVAATGPCPCGRRLPLLGSIEGRAQRLIVLEDGRIVTPRTIIDSLAGRLRLGEYRLHQQATNRFRLELLTQEGTGVSQAILSGTLREILGNVEISIEAVKSWPADGREKTHPISSEVPLRL